MFVLRCAWGGAGSHCRASVFLVFYFLPHPLGAWERCYLFFSAFSLRVVTRWCGGVLAAIEKIVGIYLVPSVICDADAWRERVFPGGRIRHDARHDVFGVVWGLFVLACVFVLHPSVF